MQNRQHAQTQRKQFQLTENFVFPIEAFQQGVEEERARILAWIEENRSGVEFEPGEYIYRDHFNSESLIAFINAGN